MEIKASFILKERKLYIIGVYKEEVMEEIHSYKYLYCEMYDEKGHIVEDTFDNRVFLEMNVPDPNELERIRKAIFNYHSA
jgi:hypothetical protein